MLQKSAKGIIISAMIGTIISSLSLILIPKRKKILAALKNRKTAWIEKAKNVSESVLNEFHPLTEKRGSRNMPRFIQGAFLGLILGAGSALLLTPKTGKQLRNNLTKKYLNLSEKTQDMIGIINNGIKIEPKKSPPQKKILLAKRTKSNEVERPRKHTRMET